MAKNRKSDGPLTVEDVKADQCFAVDGVPYRCSGEGFHRQFTRLVDLMVVEPKHNLPVTIVSIRQAEKLVHAVLKTDQVITYAHSAQILWDAKFSHSMEKKRK